MAWLWNSWEEFTRFVHPTEAKQGWFVQSRIGTRFEAEKYIVDAVGEIERSLGKLAELGFGNEAQVRKTDPSAIDQAHDPVMIAINAGEHLLLYHKRLARDSFSYGFLHSNDLLNHWERYGARRLPFEINQFIADLRELLRGYYEFLSRDEDFLVREIDLPDELMQDFALSRDLFSTGFDEAGLFFAGRGLEGVLRKIASDRKISLASNKGPSPANEADLYDLIEALSRVRWKVRNEPLVSKQTKALLHYLRTSRNSGAHPSPIGFGNHSSRDAALLVAKTADHLWNSVATTRAHLEPTRIPKTW